MSLLKAAKDPGVIGWSINSESLGGLISARPNGEYLAPDGVCGGKPPGGDEYFALSGVLPYCLYLGWSNPAGLDREWACAWLRVPDRDGVVACWGCEVGGGKVGTVEGAVLADKGAGRPDIFPGCRAPGSVLVPEPY